MSAQLKKGVLDLCVLDFINKEDAYGYSIYQYMDKIVGISESTIYPLLRRLINAGFCKSYSQKSSDGPVRKYFAITPLGVTELKKLKNDWDEFKLVIEKVLGK